MRVERLEDDPILKERYLGSEFFHSLKGLFLIDHTWITNEHFFIRAEFIGGYRGNSYPRAPDRISIKVTDKQTKPKDLGFVFSWSNGINYISLGLAALVEISSQDSEEVRVQKIISWLGEQAPRHLRHRSYPL